MPQPPDPFDALRTRNQEALLEFLRVDLDLGFTFLETARVEADSDSAHCKAALEKARAVLESVRRFQSRIDDPGERNKIKASANLNKSFGTCRGRLLLSR